MLILSRYPGQSILIGEIEVRVERLVGDRVRLSFDAPRDTLILRGELKRCPDCGESLVQCRCGGGEAAT